MITLTAKIDILGGNNKALSLGSPDLSGNNISSNLSSVVGVKKQGSNPFIIGASALGDGSTFSDNVDYFIGQELSDDNGFFKTPYEIKVVGENITSLTLVFDEINNRHPTSIVIDGIEYFDDDPIYTISLSPTNEHLIKITNWNAPKYPLVLSGLFVGVSVDIGFDKNNLVSIIYSMYERSDYKLPSYGVISNTGELKFNDLTGEIKDYANQNFLVEGLDVTLSIRNTVINKRKEIGILKTTEWDYNEYNRVVSVTLKDELTEWQDIHNDGFPYDPRNPYAVLPNGTMEDLYKWLWKETPQKYNMLSFDKLSSITQNILTNTKITYPLLESGNLWQQWTKLCQVCALYIYKDKGVTTCNYTYGS